MFIALENLSEEQKKDFLYIFGKKVQEEAEIKDLKLGKILKERFKIALQVANMRHSP